MNRGLTLIELMVGLVTAATIAAVCAKILQLGIVTYTYSVRQNASLARTRKALAGDGERFGVLWAGRGANAFSDLSPSSFDVMSSSSSSVVTNFYVAGGNLYRTKSGASVLQADAVAALAVKYYNMDASGLIRASTAAASAAMATALVTVQKTTSQKSHKLFSGARLRNHP